MNRLIPILMGAVAVAVTACVSQTEIMRKGGAKPDWYAYHYGQIGGQGTAQSSMGTAVAFDGQKSLADVAQAVTAVVGLTEYTKQVLYKEVTARYEAGQITAQQKIAAEAAIAQSTTAAQLQEALAKIAAAK